MEEYHQQKAVVSQKAILINHSKKILLLQRNAYDSSRPNGWDFPGGSLKKMEDPIQGVIRETQEETALSAKKIIPIFTKSILLDDDCWSFLIIYQGEVESSNVLLSKEHVNFTWVTKKEAEKLLPKSYQKFLDKITA